MSAPLRAVIADDSVLFRALVMRSLSKLDGVEVVGQATNGNEAVELVRRLNPDFLTLDLNMPLLDGLGALRALREAKLRCDVIVVSAETRQGAAVTLEALQLGAVDFITKPTGDDPRANSETLIAELRRQLAVLRMRRDHSQLPRAPNQGTTIRNAPATALVSQPRLPIGAHCSPEVVTIGTSTGGPMALPVVLGALPATFPLPVLIVQHMPPLFTASLAESLDRKCALRVTEANDGQVVERGWVYIAPGGRHMKIKRMGDAEPRIEVTDEPPENYCRPSVDSLLHSVARVYEGRVIAVIMTGMGNDGAKGVRALKGLGAKVIAQDEATSAVFGMPQEAIRAAAVDRVLPLCEIASHILQLASSHAR